MQAQLDDNELDDGMRRLVAAALLRAVLDAQRGDDLARAWLADKGALWCEAACGFRLDLRRMAARRPTGFERFMTALAADPGATDDDLAADTGLAVPTITGYRYMVRKQQRDDISPCGL